MHRLASGGDALTFGALAASGLIGLAYVAAATRALIPVPRAAAQGRRAGERVGQAAQFPLETPTLVSLDPGAQGIPNGGAWVVRHADGSFTAFDMHCPHLSCPYQWQPPGGKDGVFACPCHGSVFRKDGSVANGPALEPLHRRATAVEGGELVIGNLTAG